MCTYEPFFIPLSILGQNGIALSETFSLKMTSFDFLKLLLLSTLGASKPLKIRVNLAKGDWTPEKGDWTLEKGDWTFEKGDWTLETETGPLKKETGPLKKETGPLRKETGPLKQRLDP